MLASYVFTLYFKLILHLTAVLYTIVSYAVSDRVSENADSYQLSSTGIAEGILRVGKELDLNIRIVKQIQSRSNTRSKTLSRCDKKLKR